MATRFWIRMLLRELGWWGLEWKRKKLPPKLLSGSFGDSPITFKTESRSSTLKSLSVFTILSQLLKETEVDFLTLVKTKAAAKRRQVLILSSRKPFVAHTWFKMKHLCHLQSVTLQYMSMTSVSKSSNFRCDRKRESTTINYEITTQWDAMTVLFAAKQLYWKQI